MDSYWPGLKQKRRQRGILCHVQAFKPGVVDLPAGGTAAAEQAITLPDDFRDFSNLGGDDALTFE